MGHGRATGQSQWCHTEMVMRPAQQAPCALTRELSSQLLFNELPVISVTQAAQQSASPWHLAALQTQSALIRSDLSQVVGAAWHKPTSLVLTRWSRCTRAPTGLPEGRACVCLPPGAH